MASVKAINGTVDFEMADGSISKLTITWGLLMRVRSCSKGDYERFSKIVAQGIGGDVLKALTLVYCGYLCAYIQEYGSADGCASEDEFAALVPNDVTYVLQKAGELVAPKAAAASASRSVRAGE